MNAIITEGFESPAFHVVRAINNAVSSDRMDGEGTIIYRSFNVINEV